MRRNDQTVILVLAGMIFAMAMTIFWRSEKGQALLKRVDAFGAKTSPFDDGDDDPKVTVTEIIYHPTFNYRKICLSGIVYYEYISPDGPISVLAPAWSQGGGNHHPDYCDIRKAH